MVETVTGVAASDGVIAAAQLLHDFNVEYGDPTPPPGQLADRLAELIGDNQVTVLLAREPDTGAAVGVAVLRIQPSVWSQAQEVYLAELYVVASQRGRGHGRELINEVMRVARDQGADYALVVTSGTTTVPAASTRRPDSAAPKAMAAPSCWPTNANCDPGRRPSVRGSAMTRSG
jgi:ribosomal protein S18 acetylase RimI-like enzyme